MTEKVIFTEEKINEAPNLPTRVIRKIFVKQKMTYKLFYDKVKKFINTNHFSNDKLPIVDNDHLKEPIYEASYNAYLQHITDDVYGISSWPMFIWILEIIYETSFTGDTILNDIFDNSLVDIFIEEIETHTRTTLPSS
jgi:hypothetical protein